MNRPIGLFDSGVGGLTLFCALKRLLPHEQLIYLADTANMPYGDKSASTLKRYSLRNGEWLQTHHIKLLVIACHTASVHSASYLQKQLSCPVLSVFESGITTLLSSTNTQHVTLLATPSTLASGLYPKSLLQKAPSLQLTTIASSLLAPLAEEGFFDHPAAELLLPHYLSQITHPQTDALLLGCTHFSLFRKMLLRLLPPSIQLVDPAEDCAMQVAHTLQTLHLLAPTSHTPPPDQLFVSAHLPRFQAVASLILKEYNAFPRSFHTL